MQASIETISNMERKVTVVVPGAVFRKRVDKHLRKMADGIELKGFRPGSRSGKAKLKEVRRRFGKTAAQEVAEDMAREYIIKTLKREGLEPIGNTTMNIMDVEPGGDLAFDAIVQVLPDIELGDLSEIVVYEPKAEITDEDIERTILKLKWQHARYHEVQRPARQGDRVTIDLTNIVDGERVVRDGGEGLFVQLKDYEQAARMTMLPRYAPLLVGTEPGQVIPAPPNDPHADADAKNEKGIEIVVQKIEEPTVPELNADFVSSLGIESGDVEEFRTLVREETTRAFHFAAERFMDAQLNDALIAMHDVPLPETLVSDQIHADKERAVWRMWDAQGRSALDMSEEPSDEEFEQFMQQVEALPDAQFRENAEREVTVDLIYKAIIKAKILAPGESMAERQVKDVFQEPSESERTPDHPFSERDMFNRMRERSLNKQATRYILETVTMKPMPCTFQELMQGTITLPPQTNTAAVAETANDSTTPGDTNS